MYISGLAVQKKKPTIRLGSNLKLQPKDQPAEDESRPYSSENKTFARQNHQSIGPVLRGRNNELRQLSQNKIKIAKISHKNLSSKYIEKNELEDRVGERDKKRQKQKQRDKSFGLGLAPKHRAVKKTTGNTATSVTARLSQQEVAKIVVYFRYSPISILASIGLRDQFMKILSEDLDFTPLNPFKKIANKKDTHQLWLRLNKQAQLKGKYRYRQKFNYSYSAQLKALEWKKKENKKKKQESSSSDSDDDRRQKCRDMDTWKKQMGVHGKVFIIKGKYPDLRNALEQRGWVQNTDKKSNFYDLKWTTKISDINFTIVKPNQMVNHFDNNACLTSKYGLIKSIRSVVGPENMDIDRFFPKAYDLSDLGDFENFIEVFKWIYCQSLLKKFHHKLEPVDINKVKLAAVVTERRLADMQDVLKGCLANQYPMCSQNQWNFLTDKQFNKEEIEATLSSSFSGDNFGAVVQALLRKLQAREPQYQLNGFRNIWIAKPAFLSRGRGIKCLDNLNDILDVCLGKQTQYVVQKYIENPLIINRRKFDIRVWVVVQDYNPPKIWFYNQFYVRFCLEDYDTDTLKNRYAHLTNNSIQKYNTRVGTADLDTSMWDREALERYICQNYGQHRFKIMLAKMKEIVIATILGTVDQVQGRKGCFEQMGYDMMVDQDLNPWLIEVNSSPAMDYSTPITRRLVKMVMEDIVKIIVDLRKKKTRGKVAGEFKCIYSGATDSFKNRYYRIGDADKADQQ